MAFKPSPFNASAHMRHKVRYNSTNLKFGPQIMNISQPLSRATSVAEISLQRQYQQSNTNIAQPQQQARYFSSYYYKFPKIPRPKRSALYYSTWSKGSSGLIGEGKRNLRLPQIKLSKRLFSTANQKIKTKTRNIHKRFFSAEARKRRQERRKFVKWWTLTTLTVVLGGVAAKIGYDRGYDNIDDEDEDIFPLNQYSIKPQSWHLYAYSTLPLKSISRLWGQFNSITLPVWLRSPSFKLYSAIFGVNLNEMEERELHTYSNLSEFFYRKLRPGVRPIANSDLVSPSDGKVLKFGVIDNGEIEQVKGMTYSVDALLGLSTKRLAAPRHSLEFDHQANDLSVLQRDQEFAKINGISYSVDDIIGGENQSTYHMNDMEYTDKGDKTAPDSKTSLAKELSVAQNLAPTPLERLHLSGHKQLYFAVIYLAPGDYHRYHSPTNWVTTLRRHFIGELFSVAPFFQKTLQGLFVLNERVALLGYWKHGFFSMIPVGATNVGSIVVNFDKDLKTNDVYEHESYLRSNSSREDLDENTPLLKGSDSAAGTTNSFDIESEGMVKPKQPKKYKKNTVYEATYTNASRLLGGYPLTKGSEVGGFKLGSTVVLAFEAPDNFKFDLELGQKIKMGESLGHFE